jgi:hypothetical protein
MLGRQPGVGGVSEREVVCLVILAGPHAQKWLAGRLEAESVPKN